MMRKVTSSDHFMIGGNTGKPEVTILEYLRQWHGKIPSVKLFENTKNPNLSRDISAYVIRQGT